MSPELLTIVERRVDAEIEARRPALQAAYSALRNRMAAKGTLRSSVTGKLVADLCVDELNARGEIVWRLTRDSLVRTRTRFDAETSEQTKALVRSKLPPDLPDLYHLIEENTKGLSSGGFQRQINGILATAHATLLAKLDADIDLESLGAVTNQVVTPSPMNRQEFDVFISHASEDKANFVRPLADALSKAGIRVWYDEYTLKWGDGLRRSIEKGLTSSKYGIVVLSPNFFAKEWPQRELDGLTALELEDGGKRILPLWHDIDVGGVKKHSPMLGDVVGISTAIGVDAIVRQLVARLNA